jgi:catechol 2,3-dioxygenase-like lactoylglutathione lyase family enzyme
MMNALRGVFKSGRQHLRLYLLAFFAATQFCAPPILARALEIKNITLTVGDLDRAIAFYESALGFRTVARRLIADRDEDYARGVFAARIESATLSLGDETIELEQYLAPPGAPIAVDSRSNDLWFQHFAVVVSDMDKAYAHLRKQPFKAISSAPQTIPASNAAAAGIRAFKFKDPDGHPLELLYFPPGKGRDKWQQAGDQLFLGIDHSAITVSSTAAETAFWQGVLGLRVGGESLNTGGTQARLDDAPGAIVRVTGLRPDSANGPGLEFLQYIKPVGGRPAPASLRPNDIAHVRLTLEVDNLDELTQLLARAHATFVSAQAVNLVTLPGYRGLLLRDPDGHAVMLVQRSVEPRP